ncbi:MAG TPA: FKBP-type peptidyl-prolyl cis-trans isomerase [Thermoplasmatales archaeon]|nr:MAG: FKBP-type peptidyl-prolyl cis-trans isomerase [Thermoplasmata archaeon]RLF34231.1 MAG: FKBP-type peptidyl-prolyl cis-trans isomerase [Thermoplasmata archaeon]HDN50427.1 FKBP-type peptidyl-prolyl cis-trans isomerase [Thermoplasmatales archaeon]
MKIKKGDTVTVEYTGMLEDGTVFDSTEKQGELLTFEVGAGQLIQGFENAVIGMEEGEEKEITLQPSEAYGDINPQLIESIERDQLALEEEPEVGMVLIMKTPDGHEFPAIITDVSEDAITIDFNHPLAGKAVQFKIKVVGISS